MRSTLLVRQIMQQHGKFMVWTNKYEKCRTVKCWLGAAGDKELVYEVCDKLTKAGVEFKVKRIVHLSGTFSSIRNSLIVRLPL